MEGKGEKQDRAKGGEGCDAGRKIKMALKTIAKFRHGNILEAAYFQMPQNHRPQKPARAACPSQSPALQMSGGFL
jgi:hypothetical protein